MRDFMPAVQALQLTMHVVLSVLSVLSMLSMPASHYCDHRRSVDNQGDYEIVKAMGERVDEVVGEDVVLLKADVEGLEPGVIESAKGLLESYKCVGYFLPAVMLHACTKPESYKWVSCFLPAGLLHACMKLAAMNYEACCDELCSLQG